MLANINVYACVILAAAFLCTFLFTFALVPVARAVAEKIGAIDVPKDDRRMHKYPIPRLGGLAIFLGFLVGVLAFVGLTRQIVALLVGSVIIVVLGMVDDCKNLPAKLKFLVQIIAAVITVYLGDIKIDIFTNPNIFSSQTIISLTGWLTVPVTVIWIVAITNAVNLIDGLDGLAAGISSIAAVSLVFVSAFVDQPTIELLALIIAAACFGFLPHNFAPKGKKIIMGDTGSTFLGFALAVLSVQGVFKSYAVISFAVPFLILGLPIFDTAFAILRRLFTGKGIMTPDRGHIHHKLVDMGFTQKQSVFILYAMSCILGITAVVLAYDNALRAMILLFGVLIFIAVGAMITVRKNTGAYSENDAHVKVILGKEDKEKDNDK